MKENCAKLVQLGKKIERWLLSPNEYSWEDLENAIILGSELNPFFTPKMQRFALENIVKNYLSEQALINVVESYSLENGTSKMAHRVGIVMAGNLPLVGIADLIICIITGNTPIIKLSSKDPYLLPVFFPELSYVSSQELENTDLDALVTMGSNQAADYFKLSFPSLPKLLRASRTSYAVLKGDETDNELKALAEDILMYYGMGCRSVSKIFVPENYDFSQLSTYINAVLDNHPLGLFSKLYLKNRALFKMRGENYVDTGKFLFLNTDNLDLPLGICSFVNYKDITEPGEFFKRNHNHIQKVYTEFGGAQAPLLTDYPDGVDLILWLRNLDGHSCP